MNYTMTLKQARELAGLTQRELADLAGLKVTTISDVEIGRVRNPSHTFVTKVVRALHKRGLAGITAERLFPVSDEAVA